MPFPYAYYQDNYDGPVHATLLKADGFIGKRSVEIAYSGDVNGLEKSHFIFNTSGANLVIDSFTDLSEGQFIFCFKKTQANSLTFKHNSSSGLGVKFFSRSGQDIVFPSGRLGAVVFYVIRDQAILKLYEINNDAIFPELQSALNLKANLASPSLTGNPTAPTQPVSNSSTSLATTAFVKASIQDFIENVEIVNTTINWSLGSSFYKNITANTTFDFSNDSNGKTISVFINNIGTSTVTINFLGTILKSENISFEIDAGKESVYTFVKSNNKIYVTSVSNLA